MIEIEVKWRLNLQQLFNLDGIGIDDADIDAEGNLYISDGECGRVYKLGRDSSHEVFSVIRPQINARHEASLNIAVLPSGEFCLADTQAGIVVRYNGAGEYLGEFPSPGVLSLCQRTEGGIFTLAYNDEIEEICAYDEFGFPLETIPVNPQRLTHFDPGLVNLDSDALGNVYVSYGMPPYRIAKIQPDGSIKEVFGREIEFPEDAALIADIAFDSAESRLWSLLAYKESGQQVLEAFDSEGEFIGSALIPHSESLYGVIAPAGNSELYLLDTSATSGGDVLKAAISS